MTQRERDWSKVAKRGLMLLVAIPFLALAAYVGNFYIHASQFNSFYEVGNEAGAESELGIMRSHYQKIAGVPLMGWVADNVIFKDMPIYEARYFYMIGDYENVYEVLDGVDDWRADHILGSARYRIAKSLFRADEEGNERAIEEMTNQSKRYFCRAVRKSPDSNFDDVWNCDLVHNDEQREKSFRTNRKPREVRLGFEPGESDEQLYRQEGQDSRSLFPGKGDKPGDGDGPRRP